MNKQYYEANVLAEHLARRYPQGGLSPKATEIGMQALAEAYNTYTEIDRAERPRAADRPGQVHRRDLARSRARGRRPAEPRPDLPGPRPVRPGDRRVRGGPRAVAQVDRGPDPAGRRPLGQEPHARRRGDKDGRRRRGPEGDRRARQDA